MLRGTRKIQQLLQESTKTVTSKSNPSTHQAGFLLTISQYLPDLTKLYERITAFAKKTPQALRTVYDSASWQEKSFVMTQLAMLAIEQGGTFVLENPALAAALIILYQLTSKVAADKPFGWLALDGMPVYYYDTSHDSCHYRPYSKNNNEKYCLEFKLEKNFYHSDETFDITGSFQIYGGRNNNIARYGLPCWDQQFFRNFFYNYTTQHAISRKFTVCEHEWYAPSNSSDQFDIWPDIHGVDNILCTEFINKFESIVLACIDSLYVELNKNPSEDLSEDDGNKMPPWVYVVIFLPSMLAALAAIYKYYQYRPQFAPEAIMPEGEPEGLEQEMDNVMRKNLENAEQKSPRSPRKGEPSPPASPRSPRKGEPSPPASPRLFSLSQPLLAEKEGYEEMPRKVVVEVRQSL